MLRLLVSLCLEQGDEQLSFVSTEAWHSTLTKYGRIRKLGRYAAVGCEAAFSRISRRARCIRRSGGRDGKRSRMRLLPAMQSPRGFTPQERYCTCHRENRRLPWLFATEQSVPTLDPRDELQANEALQRTIDRRCTDGLLQTLLKLRQQFRSSQWLARRRESGEHCAGSCLDALLHLHTLSALRRETARTIRFLPRSVNRT